MQPRHFFANDYRCPAPALPSLPDWSDAEVDGLLRHVLRQSGIVSLFTRLIEPRPLPERIALAYGKTHCDDCGPWAWLPPADADTAETYCRRELDRMRQIGREPVFST